MLSRGSTAVHDLVVSSGAFLLALVLRLDSELFVQNEFEYFAAAALFGLTVSLVGFALGINRGGCGATPRCRILSRS